MSHQITVYRCGSFSGLYVFRNVAADRKDYFCKDAVSGMSGALTLRTAYHYAYKCGNQETTFGRFLSWVLYTVYAMKAVSDKEVQKIRIAIIGSDRVGVSFAEKLINNEKAAYIP